ncbi:MAG: 4-hydroxy-3-methylbut-2-enyl diphosphate reductase [Candidatus Omnitrophota bacterium]
MKINLAKSSGFCFGVKRAIEIAAKTAKGGKKVFMLGDIVHNEDVSRQVRKKGIIKTSRLTKGKNKILLIRAHGTSAAVIQKAGALGYEIIDATCPMVKEIHRIAKDMEKNGYRIIIIGDKKHDEVRGIMGQLKTPALVIDNPKGIPASRIKKLKKIAVVVQSTQNIENVNRIIKSLKKLTGELRFFNTICRPTTVKQQEIKKMPSGNDVMIIIGSASSANTRRLYEISRSQNPRSFWVNSRKEIKLRWFKDAKKVGVTAGASTPDWRIREIVGYLKRLNPRQSLSRR